METTKVISIGEERKKFKIITHCSANFLNGNQGNWSFRLPPLSDLGNSHKYNQCLIKFSKFIINPFQLGGQAAGVVQDNLEPCWIFNGAPRGVTVPAVILNFSIPSPQIAKVSGNMEQLAGTSGMPGAPAVPGGDIYFETLYKLQELVPCNWVPRQNFSGTGFLYRGVTIAAGPGAANEFQNNHMISYNTAGSDEGLLCANPFGQDINLFITSATDFVGLNKLYLSNDELAAADPNGIPGRIAGGFNTFKDITEIIVEFYVEMVENK